MDVKKIESLAKLMQETGLTGLELVEGDVETAPGAPAGSGGRGPRCPGDAGGSPRSGGGRGSPGGFP